MPDTAVATGLVDCDVHVAPPTIDRLLPYLDTYWVEFIGESGFVVPDGPAYTYPAGAATSRLPGVGPAANATLEGIQQGLLDPSGADVAILTCYYGIETPRNPGFTAALSRAVNDWLVAEFLDRDPRLRASLVVPVQHPAVAAAEIDRIGGHPGFVQVLFPSRGEYPYGNQVHWPIYEAAVRNGLAIGLHFGGLSINPPTPAGWTTYYLEEYVGVTHIVQSQLTSILVEGVYSRFPELRIALLESGVTWMPSFFWRMDKEWKGIIREAPWIAERPSTTIRRQMRATVAPFDAPATREQLVEVLDQIGSDDFLLYASDWPHAHDDGVGPQLFDCLDAAATARVRSANARAFYRL
jgi:predicted TIM-barrel fold metal-dependent hydrolase